MSGYDSIPGGAPLNEYLARRNVPALVGHELARMLERRNADLRRQEHSAGSIVHTLAGLAGDRLQGKVRAGNIPSPFSRAS